MSHCVHVTTTEICQKRILDTSIQRCIRFTNQFGSVVHVVVLTAFVLSNLNEVQLEFFDSNKGATGHCTLATGQPLTEAV